MYGSACTNHSQLTKPQRMQMQKRYEGKTFWLQTSLYAGFFYDDRRYRLGHPSSFDTLNALKTIDGYTILPPTHDDIIPAGTRVRIEHIRWPTPGNVFGAALYTPKQLAWVFCSVALDRGNTTLWRERPYILLVPKHVQSPHAFERWIVSLLAKTNPNPWLQTLPKHIVKGIVSKRPLVGMNERQLQAAMGQYDDILNKATKSTQRQVRRYGLLKVTVQSDKVVQVRPFVLLTATQKKKHKQ
ncbi:MAG: hypothetical protein AAF320_03185 [Myxococcota bacterium]